MKKLLLILGISILLFGCGDYTPMERQALINPFKVVKIESVSQAEFKGLCVYRVETGVDHLSYIDNYQVLDSIGKFNIGDVVYFTLNKVR